MISDQADRNIVRSICLIGLARQGADLIPDRLHGVDLEDSLYILHDNGKTLQSHAGINILLGKLCIIAVAVIIELGKDIVPDLHEAVTLAAHNVFRAIAVLLAPVIIDFRTGSAGTGAVLPEIVRGAGLGILAKAIDVIRGDPDLPGPDLIGLVIIDENGGIEPVRLKLQHPG